MARAGWALAAAVLAGAAWGQNPGPDVDFSWLRNYPAGPFSVVNTSHGGLDTKITLFKLEGNGGTGLEFTLRHRSNHIPNTAFSPRGAGRGWSHSYQSTLVPSSPNYEQLWGNAGGNAWVLETNPLLKTRRPGTRNELRDVISGGVWQGYEVEDMKSRLKYFYGRLSGDPIRGTGVLGAITDPYGNQVEVFYDNLRRVSRIEDATNLRFITLQYMTATSDALIDTVTLNFPGGTRVWDLTYDNGNLVEILWPSPGTGDPQPRVTFSYNANSNISGLTDLRGSAWGYAYALSQANNPVSQVLSCVSVFPPDPSNPRQVWNWDTEFAWTYANLNNGNNADDEKICTISEPFGPVSAPLVRSRRHLYNYNTVNNGGNVYFTNPIKRVEDPPVGGFTYWETFIWRLADGVMVEHRDKFDFSTLYTYDSQNRGLVFTKVEPDNGYSATHRTTFYNYDAAGRLILVDAPGVDTGQRLRTATAYNAQHSVTRVTIDPRTNPVTGSVDWPLGLELREDFTYTSGGELASRRKGADTATAWSNFDSYGNPGRETSPGGKVENFTYNSLGLLTQEIPAAPLGTTTYTYDALNRVRTVNKSGATTTWTYNAADQVTSKSDPANFTTVYDYDFRGRLRSVTRPVDSSVANNIIESYEYDAAGNLIRSTNGKSQATFFEYDARDLRTREATALNPVREWTYDNNGRVISMTDGKGQRTRYVYNPAGRLIREERLNGAVVAAQTSYTYTPGGELLTVIDPSSPTATAFRYDTASRRIGHYQPVPNKTLFWTLDGSGRRTSLQLFQGNTILGTPLVRWNTTYDTDLKRASVTEQLGSGAAATLAQFQYNAAGMLSQKSLFNGWSSAYGYTARGEEASIISSQGATIMQWLFWYYSLNGTMSQATRTMREGGANRTLVTRYVHDRMGRLRSETRTENLPGTQAFTNEYALDKNHNRIWVRRNGVFTYYVVNSLDQHTGGDSFNLGPYDANGSPTRMSFPGQSWTIAWDRDNRPVSFTNHLGAVEAFTYNWRGQRASRSWSGATTTYVYDGDQVIAECAGTVPSLYFVPGVSWTDAAAGVRYAVLESLQGSFLTGLLTSGAVASRMEYDAFGMERPLQGGPQPPLRWLGLQTLGSPWLLVWTGDRFYIPRLGRFMTMGPAAPNRYVLGDESPLRPSILERF